ncbi:MAG: YfhO family protein [Clostridium sp.]|nr:YfhO family protein [Clostridium sp.]
MQVRTWIKKNWNYMVAFLLPWILMVIHSVFRQSWLTGNGSILYGEAGTVYYEMYTELWEKVHHGGSLAYSWNVGLGTDFLVNIFQYMMSPFTVLVMLVPKSQIANMLQFVIVLKWSLAAVTMTYYFMHTKHNTVSVHKKFLSLVLGAAFFLGNAVVHGLANVNWGDVLILFPLLLLFEEWMAEGRGFKCFYLGMSIMLLCNFRLAVPVIIFLFIWYMMQVEGGLKENRKAIFGYLFCQIAAIFTGMLVIMPCVAATLHSGRLYSSENLGDYAGSMLMSITDIIQRLFVCDTLRIIDNGDAVIYVSVVVTAVAVLFAFVPTNRKRKVVSLLFFVLLTAGLCNGGLNLFWHAYIGESGFRSDFAFLLSFLMIYMAMTVIGNLESIRMWNVIAALIAGIAGIVYTFFAITSYLDFYVYLFTFLLYVLTLLLLVFYCRKSIQYQNMVLVLLIFGIAELGINAYVQLEPFSLYPVNEYYCHASSEVLTYPLAMEDGERIANAQTEANYGMVLDKPTASGELTFTNADVWTMYRHLGMEWSEKHYGYSGGSPLLNVLLNVRYGMSQDKLAFSDAVKKGENNEYILCEMKHLAGLGYMVDKDVLNWDFDQISPFAVQNDFVKRATGEEDIFEPVTPNFTCASLLGGERLERELEPGHVHDEEEDHESPVAVVDYDDKNQQYPYRFRKMYSGDVVTASFESDGVSDYYLYLESDSNVLSTVMIGEETVIQDFVPTRQKTFHLGITAKGETISVITNAQIDDLGFATLNYQIAAFQEDNYVKAYEKLSDEVYQIEYFDDNRITGKIKVAADGIMMTSVPAADGFKVYVDDKEVTCEKIGHALIGVPLKSGEHTVEFRYQTAYLAIGGIFTVAGILLFAGYCILSRKRTKKAEE